MTQVTQSSQKVPKLRFREFQGEWKEKKIWEIAPLQRWFDLPTVDVIEWQYPVVYSNGIWRKHSDFKVKAPWIVTWRSWTIGKVTYVTEDFWPHNTSLWVTNFFENSPKYIYYFYNQLGIQKFSSWSWVPTLNRNDVHSQKSYIPSPVEQIKIASFLSSVDVRIEQLREKKSLLEEYKKWVMQRIFAREIRFKDENGEEYLEWEDKKLWDLCKIKTGKKDVNEWNPDGQYPFFTCAKTHTYSDLYSFDCDAILIAWNGEVWHCQRYSGKFEAYQRTYVLSDFSEDIDYLYCHLNSTFQDVISSQKQMGAMPYIKLWMLTDFMIPIPSLSEQQKIASFLSEIDTKIQSTSEQLEEAEKWKKGLLQEMFV
jgi:type I restriction enzyme S subunit